LKWYDEKSFEEILIDAAGLPPHSAIFWHLMNVDAAGVAHEANAALNKLSSSDIKTPPTGFAAPIFNWRQMHRWGIGQSNLPAGSAMYFREPTAW
jgi:hypothetical protein